MPPDTPVTIPVLPTVAIPVAPELHVPPVTASVSAVVIPAHTVAVPVTVPALGAAFTVTTLLADAVPHPFVTL